MSSKIEVPRFLPATLVSRVFMDWNGRSEDLWPDLIAAIEAENARTIVECDPCPTSGACVQVCMKAKPDNQITRYLMNWNMQEAYPYHDGEWVKYSELAELQAIIAQLTAENERLKSESFEELYSAAIDERDALIERLKGGQGDPTCKTCSGTRIVDDGELTCSSGGIPYENGPIKLVKDCPICTSQLTPVSVTSDSACDLAYRNGLQQGYNLALNGSEKEFQDAISRYSGHEE